MCEEHPALFRKCPLAVGEESDFHRCEGDAGERLHPFLARLQRHDGRGGGMDRVPELCEPLEAVARRACLRMRDTARRNDECVSRERAVLCYYFGDAIADTSQAERRCVGQHRNARVGEIFFHHTRHVGRLLRLGKSPFARLDYERQIALRKEIKSILHAELRKWGIEELLSRAVVLGKGMPVEFGIGDVAASAARDVELLPDCSIFLEQQDGPASRRIAASRGGLAALGSPARRHHARGATPDNDDVVFHICASHPGIYSTPFDFCPRTWYCGAYESPVEDVSKAWQMDRKAIFDPRPRVRLRQ